MANNISVLDSASAARVVKTTDTASVHTPHQNVDSLPDVTNAGTFAVQVDGSALTALQVIDNPVFVDDAAFTLTTSSVSVAGAVRDDALGALTAVEFDAVPLRVDANGALWCTINGTVTVGSHAVTNAGTFAVQVDAAIPTGTNTIGNVGLAPQTSGGLSIFTDIDLDATGQNPKASAGQVFGYYVWNDAAAVTFLKFYNKATAPTEADTPVMTIGIPPDSGANCSFPNGLAFATGIGVRATSGVATADTGDPGANACVVNVFYK